MQQFHPLIEPTAPQPRHAGAHTNVAAPLTSFVGRESELNDIAALIARGERLITITGTAGMGKTRLALEYAARAHCASTAGNAPLTGAWFCDLTEATSPEAIAHTVGAVLDVPLVLEAPEMIARLGDAIAARKDVVLILDNFEQLVDFADVTIGRWLAHAPRARFLVTSRECLRIPGECLFPLSPLGLPPSSAVSSDDLAAAAACELFVQRARLVDPTFHLAPRDNAIVAGIVRQLDGIPLAIELAATRMGMMSPAAVLDRLERRFQLLSGGPRNAAPRHQALRGAIDWSWQLLQPWEKDALAQCAVFRGGFTLAAAEQVLALPPSAPPVIDVVQALHNKSLLRASPPRDASSERRMGMFVSIAEYAAERLAESPDRAAVHERHRRYYLGQGATWAEESARPDAMAAIARIALEQDNLIAAFRSAVDGDDAADANRALCTVLALEPVLSCRGPLATHLMLLDAAHARATKVGIDATLTARVLECRGRARRLRASWREAEHDLVEALALGRLQEDGGLSGRVLAELGTLNRQIGNMGRAVGFLDEALHIARASHDLRTEGLALGELGIAHKEQGLLDRARSLYEEALATLRDANDVRSEARYRGDLGALHQEEGRFAEARRCFEEALDVHRAVGNRRYEAIALSDLGAIDFEEGRLADAELAYRHAISILADVGDRRNCALFTACAAAVAAATDDLELAQARFAAAAGVLTKVGDPLYLGAAAVHRGHLELALARRAADPVVAEEHRARAHALIAYAEQRTTEGAPSLAELSDDVRFALRALTRALDSHARGVDGLLVGPDAAWFELNRRERITLANRVNMRRLLAALVSMRMRSPAEPIALDALYDVGWPGMKALGRAGANRVHVALAALRKLGLAEILLRRGQGYLLDPAVPVTLAPLAGTDEPSAGPPRSACPPDDLRRGLSGAQPPPQTP